MMEPARRTRRNSRSLHQDQFHQAVRGGDRDTPIVAQMGRDAKMIHTIASLIRSKSKLLLLESPDTVEIYKLDQTKAPSRGVAKTQTHPPATITKAASLSSIREALGQSCPYLYNKRRGSFCSVGSQRIEDHTKKQSYLKAQREAKKSNVTVTMVYLGKVHVGSRYGSTKDELKVLQQVNGGENICVFKGLVTPGDQFQFVSQRHRGFPFSATLYVNDIMLARISSCCEYRYSPGFQQGRKSCFRLTWLSGGVPCYRCTSLRNKYSSCQQLNNCAMENLEQSPGNGTVQSCPSSPLFIPVKSGNKSVRRTRKCIKEGSGASTDSEDTSVARIKDISKPKRRKGQSNHKESKGMTAGNKRQEQRRDSKSTDVSQRLTLTDKCEEQASSPRQVQKQSNNITAPHTQQQQFNTATKGLDPMQDKDTFCKQNEQQYKESTSNMQPKDGEEIKDFYEECVKKSTVLLEQNTNKHNLFQANLLERCRLQKKLASRLKATSSDVEPSAESDTIQQPDEESDEKDTGKEEPLDEASQSPGKEEPLDEVSQSPGKEEPLDEQDLQAQLDAMMLVLRTSDEVEQLVLRNTGLTDDLLLNLAGAVKNSMSEVTLLNLNLNLIGPYGAHILLDLLRVKPQVKGLHLFGNKLRDHGVLTLLNGIAELQQQARSVAAAQQPMNFQSNQNLQTWSSFPGFTILELDIGGNGLSSDGIKVLSAYLRHHSFLQYLGLAQTSGADLAAWKEFFDSLKGNISLTQMNLDENNLGDPGVRLLADMLKFNTSLRQVDLDRNGISDVGGNDIMEALLCRSELPLSHLSLQENNISAGLMNRIQEEVKYK